MGEYIIELKEDPKHIRLMQLKNGEDGLPVTKFMAVRPYKGPDIERIKEKSHDEGYSEGFADGYKKGMNDYLNSPEPDKVREEAYKDGVDDAWDLARKVYLSEGYSSEVLNKFFHTACVDAIFEIRNINEVLSEIKAREEAREEEQEEQEKIGVGDVVTFRDGEIGVVIAADDRVYRVINMNMMTENLTADQVKKTVLKRSVLP